MRHGCGRYIYNKGPYLRYVGFFVNNKREGKGGLYWRKGNQKYLGDFKKDGCDGYGELIKDEELVYGG